MWIKRATAITALFLIIVLPISSQEAKKRPLKMALECGSIDCPLLQGVPQTGGMRSGFVRLKPWQAVGWHTTGEHEEAFVVLRGTGEAQVEGQKPMEIASRMMVYIPPTTRHNVQNTGRELLEYVYVVAPVTSH